MTKEERKEYEAEYKRKKYQNDPAWREKQKAERKQQRLALKVKCENDPVLKEKLRLANYARGIKHDYGITLDEYNLLLSNGCNVCGSTERLHCDHDHKTGKVRGCLCHSCNISLGHMKDDPTLLRKLANYVEVHNESI
jgi:hypothetical protein